jgi:hypothetical protein
LQLASHATVLVDQLPLDQLLHAPIWNADLNVSFRTAKPQTFASPWGRAVTANQLDSSPESRRWWFDARELPLAYESFCLGL